MGVPSPSLSYFLTSSDTSLESFELSRLNRASNLRKELADVIEEWVEAEVQARFARLVRQFVRLKHATSDTAQPEIAAPSLQIPEANTNREVAHLPAAGSRYVEKLRRAVESLPDLSRSHQELPGIQSPPQVDALAYEEIAVHSKTAPTNMPAAEAFLSFAGSQHFGNSAPVCEAAPVRPSAPEEQIHHGSSSRRNELVCKSIEPCRWRELPFAAIDPPGLRRAFSVARSIASAGRRHCESRAGPTARSRRSR